MRTPHRADAPPGRSSGRIPSPAHGSPHPPYRRYLSRMCGRTTLTITPGDLEKTFGFPVPAVYRPSYNIAPTQPLLALSESRGERGIRPYRWGLVPYWATDVAIGNRMINARAETLSSKSAFREPLARRRCLVIVDGYYEWMTGPLGKRPHRVRKRGGGPFTLGGLWDRWRDGDQVLESCAIITTAASDDLAALHDRMPLVIPPDARERWVSRDTALADVEPLLALNRAEDLEMYEVSTLVNRPENDTAACIEPLSEEERKAAAEMVPDRNRKEGGRARPAHGRDSASDNYSLFSDEEFESDGSD